MTDDLKDWRASRNPWLWIALAAFVVAVLAIMGPMDYAADLEREAELKVLRAKLAAKEKPQAEIAPLLPRCKDQFIVWQADGGRWHARCVDADLTRGKEP